MHQNSTIITLLNKTMSNYRYMCYSSLLVHDRLGLLALVPNIPKELDTHLH